MIPAAQFAQEETEQFHWHSDHLKNACEAFKSDGCLWLEEIFPTAFINKLHAKFVQDYNQYFEDRNYPNALTVGDKRFMITVEIESLFNDPLLYAHPLITAFMSQVLGCEFKLGSFGVVVSLPGAADQQIHRDHAALFGTRIDDFLPSFAITMILPLVDLNEITGTTRMWRKSHLGSYWDLNPETDFGKRDYQDPYARIGDCLLMDHRLYHSGLANSSNQVRPIIYITYSRPWFRDCANFHKQPPLLINEREYRKVPAGLKRLFPGVVIPSAGRG
ncbi:MAG: phytanoyl-CoA dioxygenase family protein [Blastocatellia bacterium]